MRVMKGQKECGADGGKTGVGTGESGTVHGAGREEKQVVEERDVQRTEAAGKMKGKQIRCGREKQLGRGRGDEKKDAKGKERAGVARVSDAEEEDKPDQAQSRDSDSWDKIRGELCWWYNQGFLFLSNKTLVNCSKRGREYMATLQEKS